MSRYLIISLILLLLPGLASARIMRTVATGNWTTPGTWNLSSAPASGDTLNILPAHTVTIDAGLIYSGALLRVNVFGTWRFDGGGAKITMPCGSQVNIYPGGRVIPNSGGSSQTIRICNVTYWSSTDGTVNGPAVWPGTALPVELISFDVRPVSEGILASWSTASESGSSHFELQRSSDDLRWNTLSIQPAAGYSQERLEYSFLDETAPEGLWYYKLVQVDLDGTRHDGPVVSHQHSTSGDRTRCWPNPVEDDHLFIAVNGTGEVDRQPVVRSVVQGVTVAKPVYWVSGDRLALELHDLANGAYRLDLSEKPGAKGCLFIVQR